MVDSREIKLINKRFNDQAKHSDRVIETFEKLFEGFKEDNNDAHGKLETQIDTLSKSLFHPHKGLWAETKKNSAFRINLISSGEAF